MDAILAIVLLTPLVRTATAACPPLIGDPSPPGCNKTFVQDVNGEFPCEDLFDCPMDRDWWEDQGGLNPESTYGWCEDARSYSSSFSI